MNDFRYLHVAQLVFGQPLLATVEAAETVGAYVRARMEGLDMGATRFVGEQQADPQTGRWKGYRKIGGVAAISILGEMVNRGAWMGASSGLTSYEGIVEQLRQAAADPEVTSIVLDINSPGGEAWGMVDAARQLRSAAGGKRLVAIANLIAASAAYGLAAVADEVVVNEAGIVGSIGVVSVHFDQSERLKNAGVKATVITTGPKKVVGHPAIPLTEEGLALLQARADRLMEDFVKVVSEHRPAMTAEAVYALEGDILIGSDAVRAGLADRVGTFESVLADLTRAAGRFTPQKGRSMKEENGAPAADKTAGTFTQADLDAAIAQASAASSVNLEAKVKEAIATDRTRVAALDGLLAKMGGNPKAIEIVAAAKADGSMAEATALKLIEAGATVQAAVLGAIQTDDASASAASPAAPADSAGMSTASTPDEWKAEYTADPKLRADFATAADYVAFKKADARGAVKILTGRAAA